jgi:hypothetical protein
LSVNNRWSWRHCGMTLLLVTAVNSALGYDGSAHQTFTFVAARQFNRCVEGTDIPRLTPLQVRYMARTNVSVAETNFLIRMFRWRYYDRAGQRERSALWLVDTRFHEQFNELQRRLDDADNEVDVYRQLGRVVSYLQLVTSPAHVVPVFIARFWRLSLSDRFDNFPVEETLLAQAVEGDCGFLTEPPVDYTSILIATADATLAAVVEPIPGMPASWQAFWTLARNDHSFGEYGPAGNNFGRKTEFRCGEGARCLLLKDDPLYTQFALQRHLQAVEATMAAMYLTQLSLVEKPASLPATGP